MKSNFGAIGNINLRGKKFRLLSCGCCTMQDFRDREREKEDKKEIRAALREQNDTM